MFVGGYYGSPLASDNTEISSVFITTNKWLIVNWSWSHVSTNDIHWTLSKSHLHPRKNKTKPKMTNLTSLLFVKFLYVTYLEVISCISLHITFTLFISFLFCKMYLLNSYEIAAGPLLCLDIDVDIYRLNNICTRY